MKRLWCWLFGHHWETWGSNSITQMRHCIRCDGWECPDCHEISPCDCNL